MIFPMGANYHDQKVRFSVKPRSRFVKLGKNESNGFKW